MRYHNQKQWYKYWVGDNKYRLSLETIIKCSAMSLRVVLSWSIALLTGIILSSHAKQLEETAVHQVFRSQLLNNTGLRYVQNSGICETTKGVNQVSGYLDIGENQSTVCFGCYLPELRSSKLTVTSGFGSLNLEPRLKLRPSLCGVSSCALWTDMELIFKT